MTNPSAETASRLMAEAAGLRASAQRINTEEYEAAASAGHIVGCPGGAFLTTDRSRPILAKAMLLERQARDLAGSLTPAEPERADPDPVASAPATAPADPAGEIAARILASDAQQAASFDLADSIDKRAAEIAASDEGDDIDDVEAAADRILNS